MNTRRSSARRITRGVAAPPAPMLETLEGRTLFAAAPPVVTALLDPSAGLVNVTGTNQADNILVARSGSQLSVSSNGVEIGTFGTQGLNGFTVNGLNGHDTIVVDSNVDFRATLMGGNGRDSVTGGSGNDVVDGGNGRDVLAGADGNDLLLGGNSRDVLDGGAGDDILSGGRGRDTVTGGLGTDRFDGDKASEILEKAADEVLVPKGRR